MKVTWKKSKVDGRIGISVPYNAVFNEQFKAAVPSATFLRATDVWEFDEESKEDVIPLLEKFYLNTVRYRVAWNNIVRADNLTIDGASLAWVNRDYYKFRHDLSFRVIENELSTGGSRANPCLFGKLVIEVSLREGAVIEPAPDEIEALPVGDTAVRPNPLAAYPTSDLVAELERRGQASETAALELVKQFVAAMAAKDSRKAESLYEKMKQVVEYP